MQISKAQIDRLGDRLRGASHTESDLRLLDDYRRSFGDAYRAVVRTIRELGESPTGRPAKSTVSIVEKLRRESIRLSQMQDVAGCRVVVRNVMEQEQLAASLTTAFPGAPVIDRRGSPSHGYRAVHIIAEISGKPVEIQIRSSLQHLWAEVSEKSSDVLDPSIKYGGGPDGWRSILTRFSESVAACEEAEKEYSLAVAAHERLEKATAELLEHHAPNSAIQGKGEIHDILQRSNLYMVQLREVMLRLWNTNADLLGEAISRLDELKGQRR